LVPRVFATTPEAVSVVETLRSRPMTEPSLSVTRFVRAVVRAELASGGAGLDGDVAQRITTRLHQKLGNLIGDAGFDVLLRRSLVLARRVHPGLAGITAGPGGTLAGLEDIVRDGVAHQGAAMAIGAHFTELLVTLIGEDLAMRLLRDI
jgi:hypothetical protein